jgi:hypothetical protein
METRNILHKKQHAMKLGRVERLLGNDSMTNPFPVSSPEWKAFQEGWYRELDNSLLRKSVG